MQEIVTKREPSLVFLACLPLNAAQQQADHIFSLQISFISFPLFRMSPSSHTDFTNINHPAWIRNDNNDILWEVGTRPHLPQPPVVWWRET